MTTSSTPKSDAVAAKLASLPPLGLAAIKQIVRTSWAERSIRNSTCSATKCAASASRTTIAKASLPSSKSVRPSSKGASQATSSANFARSILPPETTQTIGPSPGLTGERRGQRKRAGPFGNRPRLLGNQAHRVRGFRRA